MTAVEPTHTLRIFGRTHIAQQPERGPTRGQHEKNDRGDDDRNIDFSEKISDVEDPFLDVLRNEKRGNLRFFPATLYGSLVPTQR